MAVQAGCGQSDSVPSSPLCSTLTQHSPPPPPHNRSGISSSILWAGLDSIGFTSASVSKGHSSLAAHISSPSAPIAHPHGTLSSSSMVATLVGTMVIDPSPVSPAPPRLKSH